VPRGWAPICEEIGIATGTAHNQISAGTFPIASRIQGKSRVIDVRDLGEYIDRQRSHALQAFVSK
jgi:hypothetical protein